MENNSFQEFTLDIKDVFLFTLKRIIVVLLVAVITAGALGGFGNLKKKKLSTDDISTANILNVNEKLADESDAEYCERVLLVNRAQTILDNIEDLNEQSDNLLNYLSESQLMQIDPLNVAVSEAQFIIELDDSENVGLDDALMDSYTNVVTQGEYLSKVADDYGCEVGSLMELISAYNTKYNSDLVIDGNAVPVRVLTIEVYGNSTALTEALLDGAIDEVNEKASDLNESVAKHTITELGRQNYMTFVSSIRDSQMKAMTSYQTLQSQITTNNGYLDDIAKQLGLSDRNDFYSDNSSSTDSITIPIKYIAVGFVMGAIIAIGIYVCRYVLSRKVLTQAQFFCLFPSCVNVGVLKPLGTRSKLCIAIDRLSGDDSELDEEKTNAFVTANFSNLTRGMNKVLLTGTIDKDTANKIVTNMKLTCDIKADFFNNPDILSIVADYDGVVILEQRGKSEKKRIRKELKLLRNGVKTIIGAIII